LSHDNEKGLGVGMASHWWIHDKSTIGWGWNSANPTDHGKKGTKRSLLTDGKGIPLSCYRGWSQSPPIKWLVKGTLDAIIIEKTFT